jgi:hypothetical protein
VALATSGGCVVALMGASARWEARNLAAATEEVSAKSFFRRPAGMLPSTINYLLTSVVHVPTLGALKTCEKMLSGKLAAGTEYVIGAHSPRTGRGVYLSSREEGEGTWIEGSVPLGRKPGAIARAALASAAIPMATTPIEVLPELGPLVDGGVTAASPLTPHARAVMLRPGVRLKAVYFISKTPGAHGTDAAAYMKAALSSRAEDDVRAAEAWFRERVGPDCREEAPETLDEACAIYKRAAQALLYLTPARGEAGYNFQLYEFGPADLRRVMDSRLEPSARVLWVD